MSKTLGQISYEAYCETTNWKSLASGAALPQWDATRTEIQAAWEAAGAAVFTKLFEERTPIDHASVKVMRSHDYCHFEIQLGTDGNSGLSVAQVDGLRKEAARLADKAVAQYKTAKSVAAKLENSELEHLAEAARLVPAEQRTPAEQAYLKTYTDRQYDYQDDYDDQWGNEF